MVVHPKDRRIVFDLINPDMINGPWIAGGAVMAWINKQPVNNSDIDVFFKSEEQFIELYNALLGVRIKQNFSDVQWDLSLKEFAEPISKVVYQTDNALTLKIGPTTVQLIKRKFFDTPKDVIDSFDLSVCQLITDGDKLLAGETTLQDLKAKRFRINRHNKQIIKRVIKYVTYGYIPDQSVIDYIADHKDDLEHSFPNSLDYEDAFV